MYVDIPVFVPTPIKGGESREEDEEGAEAAQEGDDRQGRLRHL